MRLCFSGEKPFKGSGRGSFLDVAREHSWEIKLQHILSYKTERPHIDEACHKEQRMQLTQTRDSGDNESWKLLFCTKTGWLEEGKVIVRIPLQQRY